MKAKRDELVSGSQEVAVGFLEGGPQLCESHMLN